jgi:hypothetical protein
VQESLKATDAALVESAIGAVAIMKWHDCAPILEALASDVRGNAGIRVVAVNALAEVGNDKSLMLPQTLAASQAEQELMLARTAAIAAKNLRQRLIR